MTEYLSPDAHLATITQGGGLVRICLTTAGFIRGRTDTNVRLRQHGSFDPEAPYCPTIDDAFEYIDRSWGGASEWKLRWACDDPACNHYEVFSCDSGNHPEEEIQRIDECGVFDNDSAARAMFVHELEHGAPRAQQIARLLLGERDPVAFATMQKLEEPPVTRGLPTLTAEAAAACYDRLSGSSSWQEVGADDPDSEDLASLLGMLAEALRVEFNFPR